MPRQSWDSQMIDGVFPTKAKEIKMIGRSMKPFQQERLAKDDIRLLLELCSVGEEAIMKQGHNKTRIELLIELELDSEPMEDYDWEEWLENE